MSSEIERKFVTTQAKLPQEVFDWSSSLILQGYLSDEASKTEIRLRAANNKHTMTVKRGEGLVREEYEVELGEDQFRELWPATARKVIEKRRYTGVVGDVTVEVDEYHGSLTGLYVVEVEFESEEAARKYIPPTWFGVERTGDSRFKNKALIEKSFAEISSLP